MKAILIGATGLTGSTLLNKLIADKRVEKIVVLTRKTTGENHPKVIEHIICFDQPENWKHLVYGDVLYSCMGTTLKKAGSKEKQFEVDFTYQFNVAQAAVRNGVMKYVLVSAAGAHSGSVFFYMKIKGQLEDAVKKLGFQEIHIMRPNILDGERQERRFSENAGLKIVKLFNKFGMLKKMKPTHVDQLAAEMIQLTIS